MARADRVILLGDLFTKGPDPLGVWKIAQAVGAECVLGNHDAKMLAVWDSPVQTKTTAACAALPTAAREWLGQLPLFISGPGWIAVHAGLHPFEGVEGTTPRMAILMRRWPDDDDTTRPFWWQLYRGADRVFYGHDAMRGVQVHARTVGLDSGCCYGLRLSGWLLEEERLYSAPFRDLADQRL